MKSASVARHRCHSCGENFVSWAAAQRHSDAEHHYRIEGLLPQLDQDRRGTDNNRGRASTSSPDAGPGSRKRTTCDTETHPGT